MPFFAVRWIIKDDIPSKEMGDPLEAQENLVNLIF